MVKNIIWVKMLAPFGENDWHRINLFEEVDVSRFLGLLDDIFPSLAPHFRANAKETLHQLFLIKNGKVLTDDEVIRSGDRIIIMLPLSGG